MGLKPGKRDIKHSLLITGEELDSLHELTYMMAESYGLDSRIMKYKGKRPIGLYSWDLECLEIVIEDSIKDLEENGAKSCHRDADLKALKTLLARIKKEQEEQ